MERFQINILFIIEVEKQQIQRKTFLFCNEESVMSLTENVRKRCKQFVSILQNAKFFIYNPRFILSHICLSLI